MPPATRRSCPFPGCTSGPHNEESGQNDPYITHPDCTTKAEIMEDLQVHINCVHTLPLKTQELAISKLQTENEQLRLRSQKAVRSTQDTGSNLRNKVESIPRPKITVNASQSDWQFFTSQWDRYV